MMTSDARWSEFRRVATWIGSHSAKATRSCVYRAAMAGRFHVRASRLVRLAARVPVTVDSVVVREASVWSGGCGPYRLYMDGGSLRQL